MDAGHAKQEETAPHLQEFFGRVTPSSFPNSIHMLSDLSLCLNGSENNPETTDDWSGCYLLFTDYLVTPNLVLPLYAGSTSYLDQATLWSWYAEEDGVSRRIFADKGQYKRRDVHQLKGGSDLLPSCVVWVALWNEKSAANREQLEQQLLRKASPIYNV